MTALRASHHRLVEEHRRSRSHSATSSLRKMRAERSRDREPHHPRHHPRKLKSGFFFLLAEHELLAEMVTQCEALVECCRQLMGEATFMNTSFVEATTPTYLFASVMGSPAPTWTHGQGTASGRVSRHTSLHHHDPDLAVRRHPSQSIHLATLAATNRLADTTHSISTPALARDDDREANQPPSASAIFAAAVPAAGPQFAVDPNPLATCTPAATAASSESSRPL